MEQENRNRAAERPEVTDRSCNDSPAAESEIAVICAWCPGIHVLKLQRRDSDVVLIFQQGKRIAISRNGIPLQVSHSMCEKCRAEKFPETVKRKDGQS